MVSNKKKESRKQRKGSQRGLGSSRKKTRHYRRASLYVLAVIIVLAFGYLFYTSAFQESPGKRMPDQGNQHIPTSDTPHIAYNSDPPTSGPHLPNLANWGVHKVEIPKELQVHNLEDGGVVIQYNCQNCSDLVDKLEKFGYQNDRVVVAPYSKMKAKISLTAWTRIDQFDRYDEARILRFIRAYSGVDHHPATER